MLLLCAWSVVQAQDEDILDSASMVIFHQFTGLTSDKDGTKALEFYEENLQAFRHDRKLFDEAVQFLLARDQHKLVVELLEINPFLMSQHNELALYHYYHGVAQMLDDRGWPHFKEAEKNFRIASVELERSYAPDYGFFSDVENARGYLSIVARGESTDSIQNRVCIVRSSFIYQAIDHFRDALIYNPENEIAQRNLDTLLAKLNKAGIPIPSHRYAKNQLLNSHISTDSVDIDSLNNVSSIPLLDYSLLPNNHQLVLNQLHRYDEIILLVDLSGSMDDPVGWSNEASKFRIAQQLAIFIALKLRSNVFLGAISVGQQCDTSSMVMNYPIAGVSRQHLTVQINNIRPFGHTPLNQRLRMTKNMFTSRANKKLVFLLSDGMDTCGEIPDLCGTAAMLASHGIDLSIFSFIYESLDAESRSAYSIYNCMVHPSAGTIFKITEDGGVQDQVDYIPVSNNILVLPEMDSSILWSNNPGLYQFPIEGVEPSVEHILKLNRN